MTSTAADLRNSLLAHLVKCGTPNWNTTTADTGFITYHVEGGDGTIRYNEEGHYYICSVKATGKRAVTKEYRSARAAVNYVMGRCFS